MTKTMGSAPFFPRLTARLLVLAVLGAALVALAGWYNSHASRAMHAAGTGLLLARSETGQSISSGPQISEIRLAKGTEGLLRQVSLHLSRMQGGASIGGFPGFEPPDDDERYRRRIKDRAYTPEEANHWIKEINNFLRQIIKKNPGLSLEEILQRQGLTPGQIEGYLDALREAYVTANGMKGFGVNAETVEVLESLMRVLEISQWVY